MSLSFVIASITQGQKPYLSIFVPTLCLHTTTPFIDHYILLFSWFTYILMVSPCWIYNFRSMMSSWLKTMPNDPENAMQSFSKQQQDLLKCFSPITPKIIQLFQRQLSTLTLQCTDSLFILCLNTSILKSSVCFVITLSLIQQWIAPLQLRLGLRINRLLDNQQATVCLFPLGISYKVGEGEGFRFGFGFGFAYSASQGFRFGFGFGFTYSPSFAFCFFIYCFSASFYQRSWPLEGRSDGSCSILSNPTFDSRCMVFGGTSSKFKEYHFSFLILTTLNLNLSQSTCIS